MRSTGDHACPAGQNVRGQRGKMWEWRNLRTKPAHNSALSPPALHLTKVLTSSERRQRVRPQTTSPYAFMSLSRLPQTGTSEDTFFFIGRDKTRTKSFYNKNNNNENNEFRLSLQHMWVTQGIEEVKPACMVAAEGEWESPDLKCGVRGGSRRRLKLA